MLFKIGSRSKTLITCVPQTSYYTSRLRKLNTSHVDQVVSLPPRSQYLGPFRCNPFPGIVSLCKNINIWSTYPCWFLKKLDLHTGMVLKKMWLLIISHFTSRTSEDEHPYGGAPWRSLTSIPLASYLEDVRALGHSSSMWRGRWRWSDECAKESRREGGVVYLYIRRKKWLCKKNPLIPEDWLVIKTTLPKVAKPRWGS